MSTYHAPPVGATIQEEDATIRVAEVMARILPTSTDIDADAVQMMERIVKDFASSISSIAVSLLASNVGHQHLGSHIISAANQMGFKDYSDPLTAYDSYIISSSLHGNNINNYNKKRLNNRNGDAPILEEKRARLSSYLYSRQVAKDKDKDMMDVGAAKLAVGSSSSSSSRLNASFIPPTGTASVEAASRTQKASSTGTATTATRAVEINQPAVALAIPYYNSSSSSRHCSSEVKQRIVQDYLSWDPCLKYNAVIMAERHNVTPAIVRKCVEPVK